MTDIMQQLRDNTRPAHDQIEATTPITALIDGKGDVDDFINVLKASLSYYRPFEQRVMECPDASVAAFMKPRLKTDLITRDLSRLGVSDADIAAVADYPVPDMATPEAVLGSLYVLEGSTIGGKVITKKLQQHFGWEMLNDEHFLNPYGNGVMARWKEFSAFVQERFDACKLDKDAMIRAAQDTFVSYNACLAAVPMPAAKAMIECPMTQPAEDQPQQKPQPKEPSRARSLKKTFALIAAGTVAGAAAGFFVGGFGGSTVRGWLSPEQKQTETAPSPAPAPSSYQKNAFLIDAGIGAAVFGAYSLRGMIVTVFGIQGLRAGWRKLTVDKQGKKKCPFHFDR
jgi:heme oxygenase